MITLAHKLLGGYTLSRRLQNYRTLRNAELVMGGWIPSVTNRVESVPDLLSDTVDIGLPCINFCSVPIV